VVQRLGDVGHQVLDIFKPDGVSLATAGDTQNAEKTFSATFDLLDEAYGTDALRRFQNGRPTGRVLLAAYECIAVGVAKNIASIKRRADSTEFVKQRIAEFWKSPSIDDFFLRDCEGPHLSNERSRSV
jgi:hypothetical protein